jgi:hypothetical protein
MISVINIKCFICGYINQAGTKKCVECQGDLIDPTINEESSPRETRKTTNY